MPQTKIAVASRHADVPDGQRQPVPQDQHQRQHRQAPIVGQALLEAELAGYEPAEDLAAQAPRMVARPSTKASAVAFLSRARVNQRGTLAAACRVHVLACTGHARTPSWGHVRPASEGYSAHGARCQLSAR